MVLSLPGPPRLTCCSITGPSSTLHWLIGEAYTTSIQVHTRITTSLLYCVNHHRNSYVLISYRGIFLPSCLCKNLIKLHFKFWLKWRQYLWFTMLFRVSNSELISHRTCIHVNRISAFGLFCLFQHGPQYCVRDKDVLIQGTVRPSR